MIVWTDDAPMTFAERYREVRKDLDLTRIALSMDLIKLSRALNDGDAPGVASLIARRVFKLADDLVVLADERTRLVARRLV